MGLDELVRCIELLKERMQSHRGVLSENETRTRMALIDPLLRTLGWDVSDPGVVTPEYNVQGRSADYALLRPNGQAAATIEAKRLGSGLTSHQMQMLNYANAAGISYAGLTDGNHWGLYDVFRPEALDERRILQVSIADDPAHASALKLLLLWRPNLESGKPVEAKAPILIDPPPPPPKNGGKAVPPPKPGPGGPEDWIDLFKYNPPPKTPCPTAIRFWDDSECTLKAWHEILVAIVEKLYAEKRFTVQDAPIGWSNSSYSVHTEPVHPTGTAFVSYRKIEGTPLFVNVNLNAGQSRKNSRNFLERFGQQAATVLLRVNGKATG